MDGATGIIKSQSNSEPTGDSFWNDNGLGLDVRSRPSPFGSRGALSLSGSIERGDDALTHDLVLRHRELFEVRLARVPADVDQAHRLRYQIYCEETGLLPRSVNPGGMEVDCYDGHAEQALLIHLPTGVAAGAIRLILPDPNERHCDLPAVQQSPALQRLGEGLPLHGTGEISRLCISRAFRQRDEEHDLPTIFAAEDADPARRRRRLTGHILLGLGRAVYAVALKQRLTHLVALMDPGLLRLLNRLGLAFTPIGEPIDHYGLRHPVYCELRPFLKLLYEDRRDVWDVITDGGHLPLTDAP